MGDQWGRVLTEFSCSLIGPGCHLLNTALHVRSETGWWSVCPPWCPRKLQVMSTSGMSAQVTMETASGTVLL